MYACLFGEYPVSATKDHVSMANKVMNHSFHLPSLPLENKSHVKELLFQLLEKNPQQRLCTLEDFRQTLFMSKIDFNRIYGKFYSPLQILMNLKTEWRNELRVHYNQQPTRTINGQNSQSSSSSSSAAIGQQKNFYQNMDNDLFQKFSI